MPAHLEIWQPSGPQLLVLSGQRVTVGKEAGNDVVFSHDGTVSRVHAVLENYQAGWAVRDLGSRNGTYVNEERIGVERLLHPGDHIRVGHSRLTYHGEQLATTQTETAGAGEPVPQLTRREHEVLVALCRPLFAGETFPQPAAVRQIAAELVISQAAVKQHLSNLYDKLAIPAEGERRVSLAREAIRRRAITAAMFTPGPA